MLLQAIPVLHFISSEKEIFFALIDEEKLEEKSKEKNDGKECLLLNMKIWEDQSSVPHFLQDLHISYTSPYLAFHTPPPDGI